MRTPRTRWAALAVAVMAGLGMLGGCGGSDAPPTTVPPTTVQSTPDDPTPTADPTTTPTAAAGKADASTAAPAQPRGLVYYAGRRARTGELLLFAEQSGFAGRKDLLAAVRAAMAGPPVDPDYASMWDGDAVDSVTLRWDGDEGYYQVRLLDGFATSRPSGMSMREAHLALQQVVWTLQSVGRVQAPVRFQRGRAAEPVTDLLGVPATGPDDTYLAADRAGVLSAVNVLAPPDGATVDGTVEVTGLAESFEATVGVRVLDPGGRRLVEDSTQAEGCCGRLFPWTYALDTLGWAPGVYTLEIRTDDPVGIAQGSDGPEIDTKTLTIE